MSNFRITTNGLFRTYRNNLYKNNQTLGGAMEKVQTERKFNSYSEDPAAAIKAWRLRRSYWLTGDQIDNCNYAISKYESAYSAMSAIVDGDVTNGEQGLNGLLATIEGVSDSAGASRNALGKELIQTAENMVSMLNSKYGEEFIFAGADNANIPFAWEGDELFYRGVNVGCEKPMLPEKFGLSEATLEKYNLTSMVLEDYDPTAGKINLEKAHVHDVPLSYDEFLKSEKYGNFNDATDTEKYESYRTQFVSDYKTALASGEANLIRLSSAPGGTDSAIFEEAREIYGKLSSFQRYAEGYRQRNGVSYEQGWLNYQALDKMANETTYVDIGLGMKESERGEMISGSAFNTSISGLKFLGYGEQQNLAVVVRQLGRIFSDCDADSGAFKNTEDEARAHELLDTLRGSLRYAQGQHVQLSADAKFLKTNLKQLEGNKEQLDMQIVDTEDMDMADAITQMTWAQYCYNAALRIGNDLLSQSLLDYMR